MFNARLLKTLTIAVGLAIATLSGCATSHVMVGQARPPTSPDQVRLYLRPPASKYEEIAVVDTSSRGGLAFSSQGKTDVVIDRLRADAAKLGANGILLQGVVDQAGGSVGTAFSSASASGHSAYAVGLGTSATVYHKKGEGIAIFVEPAQVSVASR
jgi:hypothetical protein